MVDVSNIRPDNRLRLLRKQCGMTQEDLALSIGTSQAAVSQLENGTRPLNVVWMRSLARALRCKPAELLAEEDNPDLLNDEEAAFLHRIRQASPEQRRAFDLLTRSEPGDRCRMLIEVEGAGTITILNGQAPAFGATWKAPT